MSSEKFEIAFSGKIVEGADLNTVKQKMAALFKADAARLAVMFSGKRMIIKRGVDEVTMLKYRGAFERAGAICEVKSLSESASGAGAAKNAPASPSTATSAATQKSAGQAYSSRYPESEQIPQALLTEPLGVSGDQISDLAADLAPVGSAMQDDYSEPATPSIDVSGLDIAPVGSTLDTAPEKAPPPPPDVSGITLEN